MKGWLKVMLMTFVFSICKSNGKPASEFEQEIEDEILSYLKSKEDNSEPTTRLGGYQKPEVEATSKESSTKEKNVEYRHIGSCNYGRKDDEKIGGGENAPEEWRNWFVDISNGTHTVCGGTLIAPRLVLTAAHCLFPKPKYQNVADKGPACNNNYTKWVATLRKAGESPRVVSITHAYKNKEYCVNQGRDDVYSYDEAIAVLSKKFYNKFTEPFCLIGERKPKVTDKCFAIGRGSTDFAINPPYPRPIPEHLQRARVNPTDCRNMPGNENFTKIDVVDKLHCTTKAPAKVDSGGVVICEREEGKPFYLMGIISQLHVKNGAAEYAFVHNTMKTRKRWIEGFFKSGAAIHLSRCSRSPGDETSY